MISPYNIFGIVKEPIFPLITEISTLLLILSCRKKDYITANGIVQNILRSLL